MDWYLDTLLVFDLPPDQNGSSNRSRRNLVEDFYRSIPRNLRIRRCCKRPRRRWGRNHARHQFHRYAELPSAARRLPQVGQVPAQTHAMAPNPRSRRL